METKIILMKWLIDGLDTNVSCIDGFKGYSITISSCGIVDVSMGTDHGAYRTKFTLKAFEAFLASGETFFDDFKEAHLCNDGTLETDHDSQFMWAQELFTDIEELKSC